MSSRFRNVRKERDKLTSYGTKLWQFYDKSLLTLAGGGFILSTTFMSDMSGPDEVQCAWILLSAWICLAATVLLVMLSYFAAIELNASATKLVDLKIELIHENINEEMTGKPLSEFDEDLEHRLLTRTFSKHPFLKGLKSYCNRAAFLLFTIAVFCILLFVSLNARVFSP